MSEYGINDIKNEKHKCFGKVKKCGVYKITNIENGKIYIGSSNNILQRWKNHIRELEHNSHKNMFLQSDWNKYKETSFIFEILQECNEEERYDVEQKYLDELFPFYRNGKGYNISEKSTSRNETTVRLFKPTSNCFDDYYIVKTKGCKPYLMDGEHCRTTSREKLEQECYARREYSRIKQDITEQCGVDDWEWD